MRISDWSSDVCSSDLLDPRIIADMNLHAHGPRIVERPYANFLPTDDGRYLLMGGGQSRAAIARFSEADRKSVVSGKSVSVRVDLGGRRFIKKKNKPKKQT